MVRSRWIGLFVVATLNILSAQQESLWQRDLRWIAAAIPQFVEFPATDLDYGPALLLLATPIAYLSDARVQKEISKLRSQVMDVVMQGAKMFGEGFYFAAGSALLYAAGYALQQSPLRLIGRDLLVALILAGGITTTLKVVLGRARPFLNRGSTVFEWFELENAYHSLPSGHTSTAFVLAAYGARKINQWWSYVVLLPLATLTGLSRMYHNQHWLSDLFVGAAIGTWVGFRIAEASDSTITAENTVQLRWSLPLQIRFCYQF